ncbi:hypothetical protein QJS10_CPB11g00190 [Acorus calamus]|uniref:Uncharacterized protein n=1 Tax=Acorus calamus TaxID=4465 RepID=A0AAV9DWG5_ACOCL|nr:hypothetical protein QJS10_CPB11g00190 [Acorus calamus]
MQISRQIRLSHPTITFATSSTAASCGEVRGRGSGGVRRDGFDSGVVDFGGVREGGGRGDCWWIEVVSKDYCGRIFAFKGGSGAVRQAVPPQTTTETSWRYRFLREKKMWWPWKRLGMEEEEAKLDRRSTEERWQRETWRRRERT